MNLAETAWQHLQTAPRLGWAEQPSPVTPLPQLAAQWALPWLGVKRDDLLQTLHGGSKLRKLDFLLAVEPWRSAQRWSSAGAIGSGHLVALAAAAEHLQRELHAEVFFEPPSHGVLENLAYTASTAQSLHFHRGRLAMALRSAPVLVAHNWRGGAVIAPGATVAVAALGLVRAGLELGQQVQAGILPEPQRLYVALGSGGTAAGLLVGLSLAGLQTQLHAVLTVEPALAPRWRLVGLVRSIEKLLRDQGLAVPATDLRRLQLDASQVGPGYGVATPASRAMRERLMALGIPAEDVYTGKAWAALMADAHAATSKGPWLLWNTVRSADPLAARPGWEARLPAWLRQRLDLLELPARQALGRRRLLQLGVAAGLGSLALVRTCQSPGVLDWHGLALDAAQAQVLMAAAEAILRPAPPPGEGEWPWLPVAQAVDAYVAGLPAGLRGEIALMLAVLDHGAPAWGRLQGLDPAQRLRFLRSLAQMPAPLGDAWNGIRDLVALGYYQLPQSWPALGYPGPMVPDQPRPRREAYLKLTAPPGLQMRHELG